MPVETQDPVYMAYQGRMFVVNTAQITDNGAPIGTLITSAAFPPEGSIAEMSTPGQLGLAILGTSGVVACSPWLDGITYPPVLPGATAVRAISLKIGQKTTTYMEAAIHCQRLPTATALPAFCSPAWRPPKNHFSFFWLCLPLLWDFLPWPSWYLPGMSTTAWLNRS